MASDLLKLIKARRERIAQLEAEVATMRAELREATELLLNDDGAPARLVSDGEGQTAGGASSDLAEAVLAQSGHPLHVNDLLSGIEKRFHRKVRYATLVGNLSRAVKAGRTFRRTAPNVFGLLAWDSSNGADPSERSLLQSDN